jgi:8-amino-3,8-dideoxy-alpha-D-manno-octulosonate transaminase
VRTAPRLAIDGGTPVRTKPLRVGKGVSQLGEEERAAVLEVLESRSLFRYYGPHLLGKVAAFEDDVCEQLGTRHAVATSSGTAALRTAFAALGIGCGDEVIVPAFTFIATVNAVVTIGAVPVFAEIDDTLNLDPADAAARVTARTAAVVPVHLENVACDMDSVAGLGGGVPVVEDACQSLGASYKGRALGTIGTLGCLSLQLSKNITSGEGGVVLTDDDDLYLRAARYQDHGGQFVTQHAGTRGDELGDELAFAGENLRMTELAGAIAGVQLRRLDGIIEGMRSAQRRVLAALGEVPGLERRRVPDPAGDGGSSITFFGPSADFALRAVEALRAEGVPCAQMYDGLPVYATPAVLARRTASNKGGPWHCAEHPTTVEYRMGMCPRTEDLASRSVTVAMGPAWSDHDCADVAEAVAKVAGHLIG